MPTQKPKVKREITVDKIVRKNGRLKSIEQTTHGRVKDVEDVSQVLDHSVCQSGCDTQTMNTRLIARSVPVFYDDKTLMPTTPSRARRWIKCGKATPFKKFGVFCIRLNFKPSDVQTQDVVVGIDPGSKREGFTVKSKSKTYLNVLSDAVTWVKNSVEVRKNMRRSRRFRTTPCRKNKMNKQHGTFLAPSTKARWGCKLRIVNQLIKIYPISTFVVEDINAESKKGCKKWNQSFSPLEVGKKWFYKELEKLGDVHLFQGYDTFELRNKLGLVKTKSKLENVFSAHNVDSWVLAYSFIGGNSTPDNEEILKVEPIRFHRRQLHYFCPAKNGVRKLYGGTVSVEFSKGSLVKHPKWGLTYIGGNSKRGITLHSVETGDIKCRNAKIKDINLLTHNKWRTQFIHD